MADTGSKVIEIISDKLDIDVGIIKPESEFINDLGADSLDLVEMIMEFENAFEMSIPDDEAEQIKTVSDAIEYIEKNK